MDGTLAISIVAVAIAAVSLALAVRADRRAGRAEARGDRARLVVEPYGSAVGQSGRRFDLGVRNVGLGVATRVRVWLEDESGRTVARGSAPEALTLVPGDEPVAIAVIVPDSALPPPPVAFSVWIAWSDGAGDHDRRPAGVTVST